MVAPGVPFPRPFFTATYVEEGLALSEERPARTLPSDLLFATANPYSRGIHLKSLHPVLIELAHYFFSNSMEKNFLRRHAI